MAKQKAYGLLGIFIITYWDKSRRISDKGNCKEAGCKGRTESNGYDEMDRIDE